MKNAMKSPWVGMLCGCLLVVTVSAQTMIENFEYASDDELLAAWSHAGPGTLSLSPWVAPNSTGTNSMRVDRVFAGIPWESELLTGPVLPSPLTIASTQYLTLRISGDPQFTNASWQALYLYAHDGDGNFGRWSAPVPTKNNWQVFNFLASGIQQPWNSPGLPNFTNIVRFDLYLYGEDDMPGAGYPATIYVDDIMVRNTPLIETPPATFGPAMIDDFETYASTNELLTVWDPQNATLSLSPSVAAKATGTNSLCVGIYIPAYPYKTEMLTGLAREVPIGITSTQYLTFRITGDPQFTNASFQSLYLYAYDAAGNFGRWGAPVPTATNWQVFNFPANDIEKPWNSSALPDLSKIIRFSFLLYGQGNPEGAEYTANFCIDELQIRDSPLLEFPTPSPMRSLIDDFEGYANDTALLNSYTYENSSVETVTTASLETPAPQGSKALKLGIDFNGDQYPWGSVRSGLVAPFSLPTNAVVTFRLKGDPALASVADSSTTFWLSFYDEAGRGISFITPTAPVISSEWTTLQARFDQFGNTAIMDTGNLVQWRILVQGWEGTPESPAKSAAFYIDDIRINLAPVLAVIQEGGNLTLRMNGLIPGATYTLRMTPDFSQWTTTTINATSTSATWPIPAGQKSFYQLFYTP